MTEKDWEKLAEGKSGDVELEKAWLRKAKKIFDIFCIKQTSYGPFNIAKFGEKGCVIRANDKIERLINLHFTDAENQISDETIQDTWCDLADYAIIAWLCRDGEWPFLKEAIRTKK